MARPTKLTPETHAKIVQAIRDGNYLADAARAAGISRDTVHAWKRRGKAERTRLDADPNATPLESEAAYLAFSDAEQAAEAEATVEIVQAWRSAAMTDWRAAMEWLARRHPEEWGKSQTVRIGHADSENQPVTLRGLADLMQSHQDDEPTQNAAA